MRILDHQSLSEEQIKILAQAALDVYENNVSGNVITQELIQYGLSEDYD